MKKNQHHYTYWITNIQEQKHYIGLRTSNIHPLKDLGLKYFSSSTEKEFTQDQKENPQNYEYRISGTFSSRKLAELDEIEQHDVHDVGRNPRFYNKVKQVKGGFDRTGVPVTDEQRKQMSNVMNRWLETNKPQPHSEETKSKIKNTWTDKKKKERSEQMKKYWRENPPSDKLKEKWSEAQLKRYMENPITDEQRKEMSDSQKKYRQENPVSNHEKEINRQAQLKRYTENPVSEKTKTKRSESLLEYYRENPITEDQRKKNSEAQQKYFHDHPKGADSDETKRKKSESAKLVWEKRRIKSEMDKTSIY